MLFVMRVGTGEDVENFNFRADVGDTEDHHDGAAEDSTSVPDRGACRYPSYKPDFQYTETPKEYSNCGTQIIFSKIRLR